MKDKSRGEDSLPTVCVELYEKLFQFQELLTDIRRTGYHRTHGSITEQHLADLMAVAAGCNGDVYMRRDLWAHSPSYSGRWAVVAGVGHRHPDLERVIKLVEDFFDRALLLRVMRCAKQHIDKKNAHDHYYSGPLHELEPMTGLLNRITLFDEYCRRRGRKPGNKSILRRWVDDQLAVVKSAALLVCGCITYNADDEDEVAEASQTFKLVYAIAVGASETQWDLA